MILLSKNVEIYVADQLLFILKELPSKEIFTLCPSLHLTHDIRLVQIRENAGMESVLIDETEIGL